MNPKTLTEIKDLHGQTSRTTSAVSSVNAPARGHRQATPIRIQLNQRDRITGRRDDLFCICFVEPYQGYMIYSLPGGWCCIHTKHGCLQLDGRFACFPASHDAIRLIDWFVVHGWTTSDPQNRRIPPDLYLSLSRRRKRGAGKY